MKIQMRLPSMTQGVTIAVTIVAISACAQRKFNSRSDSAAKTWHNEPAKPAYVTLPSDYEDKSGCNKLDYLWKERILKTQYTGALPPAEGPIPLVPFFKMNISMNRQSDELPETRAKSIHRSGSVAKVEFIAEPRKETTGKELTGLLAGNTCNLVRLSLALPDNKTTSVPGAAFKMFVDGAPSQNFVSMFSLDGQPVEQNFFANTFSNVVPPPKSPLLQVLALAFERASPFPTGVFLQDISSVNSDGTRVENPKFPYRIYLEPNPQFKKDFTNKADDFRKDLNDIKENTLLYTVYAVIPENTDDNDSAKMFSEISHVDYAKNKVKVGSFVTRSEFVSSKWADESLFFKHQRFFNKPSKKPFPEDPNAVK